MLEQFSNGQIVCLNFEEYNNKNETTNPAEKRMNETNFKALYNTHLCFVCLQLAYNGTSVPHAGREKKKQQQQQPTIVKPKSFCASPMD